ncbi:hypothetical protein LIA77_01880 [Sarocladium implicatum]|nr:hypothetical protein LIA77_01880 [Sarocladium implicatum]
MCHGDSQDSLMQVDWLRQCGCILLNLYFGMLDDHGGRAGWCALASGDELTSKSLTNMMEANKEKHIPSEASVVVRSCLLLP